MICNNCGAHIDDDAKFCEECGSVVEKVIEKHSFCPGCGSSIKSGVRFCSNCGYNFETKAMHQMESATPPTSNGYYSNQQSNAGTIANKSVMNYKVVIGIIVAIAVVIFIILAATGTFSNGSNDIANDIVNNQQGLGTPIRKFEIEGKWKNVGTETCAQMQRGAITTFDGTKCNVYSPSDTYAFYKDGSDYKLECTSFFAGDTMSFVVVVKDNDNIELYYGGDKSRNPVTLSRVG